MEGNIEQSNDDWFRKGESYGDSGNHKEAIECYDKEILKLQEQKEQKDITELYFLYQIALTLIYKGVALYRLGKNKENEDYEDYYHSIEIFNESFNYINKAINIIYENRSDPDDFNKIKAKALKNKGNALSLLKKYSDAIECYNEGIALNPNYLGAWANKGNAFYGLERHREAIKSYDNAILIIRSSKYDPVKNFEYLLITTYLNRGQSKYNLKEYSDALNDFEQIDDETMKMINNPSLLARKYNNIGLIKLQTESYKTANTFFHKAIEHDSKFVDAYYNLAVLYNRENNLDKTKKWIDKCLKIDPNYSYAVEAIKKLESFPQFDWYRWWFTKTIGMKSLGLVLITFLLSLMLMIAIIIGHNALLSHNFSNLSLGQLTILMAFLTVILLLPSLTKVKIGEFQLETKPTPPEVSIDLEPSSPSSRL